MASSSGKMLRRANPSTIQDKFLVGYQGWFTCAGDGPPISRGHHGWIHWFDKPLPDGGRPTIDAWPDVSDYSPSELYTAPGLSIDDKPALLFSSRNSKTVQRHFNLMAMHGVDGAFLQRFAGQCEVEGRTEGGNSDIMRWRDEVGDHVREAAEKEGRVFAIMYDVSGVPGDKIEHVIKVDWPHLINDKRILDSPAYLREDGRPVVALWGLGFVGRGHDPESVRRIVRHIRSVTPGGAYVMAGAPTHWQILRGDADPNPGFSDVWYNEFDAISPWTVGRYHNQEAADHFLEEKIRKDMKALKEKRETGGRKIDYIPVIFPGASGNNLSHGKWKFNDDPRDGGKFFWRQLYNVRKEGVRIIYGAMWDEYDEATAILPIVQTKRQLPAPGKFLALDQDGYDLPPDWFMRISGFAAELLRGERTLYETFPVKELQDYWSSRPKYEETSLQSGSSTGPASHSEGVSESFAEWIEKEREEKDEVPPPPYTLEISETEAVPEESQARVASPIRQQTVNAVNNQTQASQTVGMNRRPDPSQDGENPSSRPTSELSTSTSVNRTSSMTVGRPDTADNSVTSGHSNPVSNGSSNSGGSSIALPQQNSIGSSEFQGGRSNSIRNDPSVSLLSNRFSQQSIHSPAPNENPYQSPSALHHARPPPTSTFSVDDQASSSNILHLQHHDEPAPEQWPPAEWHVRPSVPAHRPPSAASAAQLPRPAQAPFYVSTSPRPLTPGRPSHSPSPPGSTTPGFRPLAPSAPPFSGASSYSYSNPSGGDAPYGFMPPAPSVPQSSGPGWCFENPAPFPQAPFGPPSSPPIPPADTRPPLRVSSLSGPSSYYPQTPADTLDRPGSAAYHPAPPAQAQSSYPGAPPHTPWTGYSHYNSPGGFATPPSQYPSQHPIPGGSSYSFAPPPVPPRLPSSPGGQITMPQAGNTGDRFMNVASGAYSMALGAVDKVAGSHTRRQVEHGVDSVTETGMKLLGKLRK